MTSRKIAGEKQHREFTSYINALLNSGDEKKVLEALADLIVPPPYRVRIKVVYSSITPSSVFKKLSMKGILKRESNKALVFSYRTTIGREVARDIKMSFIVCSLPSIDPKKKVQAVISICRAEQWTVLCRLIKNQYPKIVPILLSQTELVDGIKLLRRSSGHHVHVKSLSAKEWTSSDTLKSVREWTDENLDQVLSSIQERKQQVSAIEIEFYQIHNGHTHVVPFSASKIRKLGEIEVSGNFKLAFNTVITQVAKVGKSKLDHYSGRGLRDSSYDPRPLAINFSTPLFESVESVRSFVSLLKKYPRSMHAVKHGNPYGHVKVTDLFDSSSFEVWAIPPDRVSLIPGIKATEAAFERLVDYIFYGFGEGNIADYVQSG